MARQESDREDLMREAVALVRRVECETVDENDSVISGFRKCGSLSLYFGADPVYHFDGSARLRRAFVGGFLYRTQGITLSRLKRVRTKSVTELRRHDLTDGELTTFLAKIHARLQKFSAALEAGNYNLLRQIPSAEPIVPDLIRTLQRILQTAEPLAPPISGKG